MIRLQLHADGLGRTRFAVSPIGETINVLLAASAGTLPKALRGPLRDTIRRRRLDLLAALVGIDPRAGHYIPDFLTPPTPRFESTVEEELHAVATTPAWRVAGELGVVAGGSIAEITGRELSGPLRAALDGALATGETAIAGQLAAEIEQVWLHVLAPRWARVRARMEADVAGRLRTVGEHGLAATLNSLNPTIGWEDGELRVRTRFEVSVPERSVVLVPSVFTTKVLCVVDTMGAFAEISTLRGTAMASPTGHRRSAMVFYPIARQGPGSMAEAPEHGELIGRTRARILAATCDPATTGEVAGRLRLSQSTVSYHLQILYRAGLVRRTRDSRRVLYQAV